MSGIRPVPRGPCCWSPPPDVSACPMDLVLASLPISQAPSTISLSTSPTLPCTPAPSTAFHTTSSFAPPPASSLPPVTVLLPPPRVRSSLFLILLYYYHGFYSHSCSLLISPAPCSSFYRPYFQSPFYCPSLLPMSTTVPTLSSTPTAPPASLPATSTPSSITTLAPYVPSSSRKTTAQP